MSVSFQGIFSSLPSATYVVGEVLPRYPIFSMTVGTAAVALSIAHRKWHVKPTEILTIGYHLFKLWKEGEVSLNATWSSGDPLQDAILLGDPQYLKALLIRGADPNARKEGMSPLLSAVRIHLTLLISEYWVGPSNQESFKILGIT